MSPLLAIPAPIRALFKLFPLATLPADSPPASCPPPPAAAAAAAEAEAPQPQCELHLFLLPDGGRRSHNPSCLEIQTLLALGGRKARLIPSTNHASPSGSLPFIGLLPSNELIFRRREMIRHAGLPAPPSAAQAYAALLDGPIRSAWLFALYLSPANEPLLRRLYLDPVSRSGAVRAHVGMRVRRAAAAAAAAEAPTQGDAETVYAAARDAFGALETILADEDGRYREAGAGAGEGAEWFFFGMAGPTAFDAHVYSYTELLLNETWEWGDRTLPDMVREFPRLVAQRERISART